MNAENDLLLHMLAEIEVHGESKRPIDLRCKHTRNLVKNGVYFRVSAVLFDHPPDAAERKQISRAAGEMVKRGWLAKVCDESGRARYLRFKAEGLAKALELADGQADPEMVRAGLLRTEWGKELAGTIPAEGA